MLTPEEQSAFLKSADNVRQAAERHLTSNRSMQSVIAFVANLQRGVSQILQTAIDNGAKVACQAGCNHCCSVQVEAMAPEVFHIARKLGRRPTEKLDQLVQSLERHAAVRRSTMARCKRTPCPFLNNALCSIYDVRPSVCRKAHSLDVTSCRAHAAELPQELGVVVAAEALAKGTADGYGKLGFDARGYELAGAVLLALTDPTAEFRWYNGGPLFVSDGAES